MYSKAFCKIYNEFGWNYFPRAFGEQLLEWLRQNQVTVKNSLDLGCGTGILCEILQENGIQASGMDFSEGMIAIARESNPQICYEVADMIQYRPDKSFDLVTCTGDALNHIIDLKDVEQIFKNVYGYMNTGGYFIFDILNEKEVSAGEPIDLDFSDTVKAQFLITQNEKGIVNLRTTVFEDGELQFEENIAETVHDPAVICGLLQKSGFQVQKCADQLLEDTPAHGTTWFVIAKK
ncbi:MAG: class I SAM-dependent methyltransferase [Lachnospiraceae bacterium]|nr:class I SAM-dependent methyltransferase [Lachnospiraceae bacterium]